jgi:Ser/Thr protein kinase RdoA (MazF antagonist)
MEDLAAIGAVMARYDAAFRPRRIEAAVGGLSAGGVWRLETAAGPLCLRRWPPGTAWGRVAWIHTAVRHAISAACHLLPAPLATLDGAEFVLRNQEVLRNHEVWNLSLWLPGSADFPLHPSPERLRAAMRALAEVHAALADFRIGYPVGGERETPAIMERLRYIEQFSHAPWREQIVAAPIPTAYPELAELRRLWLDRFPAGAQGLADRLRAALGSVPIQCCLRDIWHAHVLFTGDCVTGIVDLGAIDFDTRATDLARLLGSLVGDDFAEWQIALAAYRAVRDLSPAEESLAYLLDEANVLLIPAIWLDWLLGKRKHDFANPALVRERLRAALGRLGRPPTPSGPAS